MTLRTAHRQYLTQELRDLILNKSIPEPNSGCWIWLGGGEYGKVKHGHINMLAHRLSYAVFKRRPREGMMIRHLCNNSSCVNPDHLEEGTSKDNYADRAKQLKRGY